MIKRDLATDIRRIAADETMTELARAMGDEDTAVKEQIKTSVMQSAREIFEFCYLNVTGSRRSVWHEQDAG